MAYTPALPPLPSQPPGAPWPAGDWPVDEPSRHVDGDELARTGDYLLAGQSHGETGQTLALVAVHGGAIVMERYADGLSAGSTLPSWSMAKSMLHALAGLLARNGSIDPGEHARVPEWQSPDDPRCAITIDHLLRMSSGLAFREDYVDGSQSDVIPMLFGPGKDDVAAFAAAFPPVDPPGAVWSYASGTTNIMSGLIRRALGDAPYRDYVHGLFERLGMRSAAPRFDVRGTWIASSFVLATARDFARFGLLYLRDGVWEGRRLLPEGWVDYARTPAPACTTREYGAHWWLDLEEPGVFYASGYEGQRIIVDPARDLVLVRLGKSRIDQRPVVQARLHAIIRCFPRVATPV